MCWLQQVVHNYLEPFTCMPVFIVRFAAVYVAIVLYTNVCMPEWHSAFKQSAYPDLVIINMHDHTGCYRKTAYKRKIHYKTYSHLQTMCTYV